MVPLQGDFSVERGKEEDGREGGEGRDVGEEGDMAGIEEEARKGG